MVEDTHPAAALPAASGADLVDSYWATFVELLPHVPPLLRALALDPRVPARAKAVTAATLGYALLPVGPRFGRVLRTPVALSGMLAAFFGGRHLIAEAGYDIVRELWGGTDAGFGLLVVCAGISH